MKWRKQFEFYGNFYDLMVIPIISLVEERLSQIEVNGMNCFQSFFEYSIKLRIDFEEKRLCNRISYVA